MKSIPAIVIHGGAWAIPDRMSQSSHQGVIQAARVGFQILDRGGSAVDAVEAAVMCLEDDPVFDAGTGSVLNADGQIEMDAMIMNGSGLELGSVACVKDIKNPVNLARKVMEESDHTLLVGEGANDFASEQGIQRVPPETLLTAEAKKEYDEYVKFKTAVNISFRARSDAHDTVGSVAVDSNGNTACATSTGGITAKRPGRVGDSPLVGSGGYADDHVGAASTTGHGESISKVCLAHSCLHLMQEGDSPQAAAESSLISMQRRVQGNGGIIAVSHNGQVGVHFTTERMPWAYISQNEMHSGINPGDHFIEKL
ncbi:hypothetical protein CAPTEDRAFT_206039 [Capitella teleta]|uniref:Uncharacterized protein n=1 Tax=Capitella teleta TaxID=283909 RepID=R7UY22_CAPTE|nr:hypothetical protein CAPTEDRAFT_206039 [Capitella teleta]|eukprot:ELU08852.1 hypothetical protein CAPTEDRAFT_206039 [Capitella teleta]